MSAASASSGGCASGGGPWPRPPVLQVPYSELCEERIRRLWLAYDEVCDRFPELRGEPRQWQPLLWQARGLAPHRSLVFRPCKGPRVYIVLELCVDREGAAFFPVFSLKDPSAVRGALPGLEPFVTDLKSLATTAVAAFRRFRKYSLVAGSCQDYVLELGKELGVSPLSALQPQADRLTEEIGERTRPGVLSTAGFVAVRIVATVAGCTPAIAAMDGAATLSAAGQLSRALYRRLRNDNVPPLATEKLAPAAGDPAAVTKALEAELLGAPFATGSFEEPCGGGRCRARRYRLPSEHAAPLATGSCAEDLEGEG